MSYYPLFADLHDRPVLLVGAGHIAERKAESLIESGAKLRVVADQLSKKFQQWLVEEKIEWLDKVFSPELIDGTFLVVAATNNSELNTKVFQAAQQAAKLCNSVDDPQHCSFTVPAVVKRGALQVAVSSGGTAPVLARSWRQRIEKLLPLHLGEVAELAGKLRPQVCQKIARTEDRRYFWQQLFHSRFDTFVAKGRLKEAEQEFAAQLHQTQPLQGEVVLVGAGPGDAGLLTIHALQAIQSADVVFYDALVSSEIMALVRKDANKIGVGKRAGLHMVQQEETNWLLVEYAQKGLRVVRLKGGDPFVFGRGGEEAQVLAEAGIPFRIVPGVTAALGATAYAGIPLTHRDCAQTALFVTGHCRPDGNDLHWQTLARGHQTLVIYMGTIKAAEIAEQLIKHGRDADTPVAVVSNGTLDHQQVQTGLLKNLPKLADQAPRPALIVIGEVVSLRNKLQWFGEKKTENVKQPAALSTN